MIVSWHKVKFRGAICFLVITIVLLMGCGGKQTGKGDNKISETGDARYRFIDDGTGIKDSYWEERKFEKRYVNDQKNLEIPGFNGDEKYVQCNVLALENEFAYLDCFLVEDKLVYFLSFSDNSKIFYQIKLSDYLGEDGVIQSFTAGAESEIILGVSHAFDSTKDTFQKYTVLGFQKDGKLAWKKELTECIEQAGLWQDSPMAGTILGCDKNSNLYLVDQGKTLFVLSRDGEQVFKESTGSGVNSSFSAFQSDEGNLIVCFFERGSDAIFRLDSETRKKIMLLDHGFPEILKWYGMKGNEITCATSKELVQWNVVTGERKAIVSFEQSGVSEPPLAVLSNGKEITLFFSEDGKQYLIRYAELKDEEQIQSDVEQDDNSTGVEKSTKEQTIEEQTRESIRIVSLCGDIKQLKGGITEFDREERDIYTSYQKIAEDAKARELIDFAVGEGADVMLVSREDFRTLAEKGCLADISDLIGTEIAEKVLPGAKEMGTIDNHIFGLPFAIRDIDTLIINRELWQKDYWNYDDVLEVLKGNPDLQGVFLDVFGMDDNYHTLYLWIGQSLGDSSFVQDKRGFESENFRRILETVKEKSHDKRVTDAFDCIKNKEYLGMQMKINDIMTFCITYKRAGEEARCIGVPSVNKSGNYLNELGGILVVNAKSVEKKGVKELTRYLLGEEVQMNVETADNMLSVRYDIPEKYVKSGEGPVVMINGRQENGSSYLDQYIEFLKSAMPANDLSEPLFEIVWEEAESYFVGDKSLDATIEVIQNRVGLYMSE
ncbi:MAG: carbohydrate ABC transporter substrate-binding protein [Lachnospiraceae bacterium]|nr:carbohydrate ABC transporter substrate-binding protein [Lachnospiraceae bacterium]